VANRVRVSAGRIEDLPLLDGSPQFDGAFANFGALNCVADIDRLGADIGARLKPGSALVCVMMGPVCAWEVLWQLAHGSPRKAVRRLRRGGTVARAGGHAFVVRYPSPGRLARALDPSFALQSLKGLGLLLPPSYAAGWLERRPALLRRLDRVERGIDSTPLAAGLSDHYVATFRRRALS
jgi:hypothetical protein